MGHKDREIEHLAAGFNEMADDLIRAKAEAGRLRAALEGLVDPRRGEAVHVGYWKNILEHPHGDGCFCHSCRRARLALAAIADANAILAENGG